MLEHKRVIRNVQVVLLLSGSGLVVPFYFLFRDRGVRVVLGSSINDGDGYENVTLKVN